MSALLTRREAAARLGLSVSWLAKAAMSGGGPRFIKLGKSRQAHVRYRVSDIDAWIEMVGLNSTSEQIAKGLEAALTDTRNCVLAATELRPGRSPAVRSLTVFSREKG